MLPVRRNLRRYKSKLSVSDPDWSFWDSRTGERNFMTHGPREGYSNQNSQYLKFLQGSNFVGPFYASIERSASAAETTASSMMYVASLMPRSYGGTTEQPGTADEPVDVYYDALIDYEYNYSTFNAIPGTMVNDQWSVEVAAADNYPYDHVYAKTSKPNYSGQTFAYDVVSDPATSTATWENHIHSTQWRDNLLALYPDKRKVAQAWNGTYLNSNQVGDLALVGTTLGDIQYLDLNTDNAFRWGEDGVPNNPDNTGGWGVDARLRCELAGSWLAYCQATNVSGSIFQWTVRAVQNVNDGSTIVVSTDNEWEMAVAFFHGYYDEVNTSTLDAEEKRKYYTFVIYRVATSANPSFSGDQFNRVSASNFAGGSDFYSGVFTVEIIGPNNHLTNDELREFLDAFTYGSSFGDEIKRFHVDQAESTLYLGTTNTNFWLDGDYPWHELKKYAPIALNDDLYLVGGYDLEDGYHKIKLDATTFPLSRGEGGVYPPIDGTFNRDGSEQDILYVSGTDPYGRTIDWAANNGGQLWLSVDGDVWTEETTVIWGSFDAGTNTQTLSGVTIDPTASVYISFVDPAVGAAITEDYELSSLRIVPEPVLEASPRPLKGGEWEFVSSTEFHFSEQSLGAGHSFPASGSVYLSRDGGAAYEEFIIGSVTTANSVVEVTWAGGSPVWTDAPADVRIAYLDPAVSTVSADKNLASFYFQISDTASQDITAFVNTEEIQPEDHLKINDTLYEIKEVEIQAGYVRFGVDADLSSITTGPAKVEFIHSEQPYTFFTRDGKKHHDIDVFQSWLTMIYDSEPLQFINPLTGLREDDWWGRKAVRVRADSGEIITVPMHWPRFAFDRLNEGGGGVTGDVTYGLPSDVDRGANFMINTGFNQFPGFQEPGVRRHRQGDVTWEFLDMKQPTYSTKSPGDPGLTAIKPYTTAVFAEDFSMRYLTQEYGLWNANIEATYGSDQSFDWIGSNPTRERWRMSEDILGLAGIGDILEFAFNLVRQHGVHWLDDSHPWWDINLGAEGYAHYSLQEWKADKLPWRLNPDMGYMADLTDVVIDYEERITADYSLEMVDQTKVPIVINSDYFPYDGLGDGGGDSGGGGGSARPDSGMIYPRRFG